MKRIGIRLRILLAMMAVISGFLVLTSWVMDGLVNRFLDAEISNSLTLGRQAYASFSDVRNAVLLDQARSIAQVPHLRAVLDTPDVDEQTVRYTLATVSEAVGASLLFVTDSHARMIADTRADTDDEMNVVQNPGVERALLGEEYCGIWDYAGRAYLVAISPVTLDSNVLGLLGIGYPLDEHVEDLRNVTGLDATVMRGNDILVSAWAPRATASSAESIVAPPSQAASWSKIAANQHSRLSVEDREYMATAIPLEPQSVRLILSRPLDQVLVYFQNAKTEIWLSGLAVAVIGLFVSQWISMRIARPIRDLTNAANTLARGELSAEVHVVTEDEIGILGRAFNAMARQLEGLMQKAMQKAKAAEQANEAKSVFLANMSHEIRTPLNGVLGFTEQLLETSLSTEQRDHVLVVRRSGEDLLAILNEILDFAKIESGRLALEQVEFHVATCIERAIEPVEPVISRKGLTLDAMFAPDVPEFLVGPASRLRQIVLNFVSNAAKFMAQGSIQVRVSLVSETSDHAVIKVEVEDTGIGIAANRIGHLFKPFSQLDSGSNREYGGTGLGLAICKELAELLHGDVGVKSELGRGSVFWFTAQFAKRVDAKANVAPPSLAPALPTVPVSAGLPLVEMVKAQSDAPDTKWRASQRILVAEDNPVNQRMIGVILKKAGWNFSMAANGREAVDLMQAERFDLILMDCQMPLMDGLEATRRIREIEAGTERHITIVALTANAFEADREACFAAGMDDFVAKPFKAPDLVLALDRRLGAASKR